MQVVRKHGEDVFETFAFVSFIQKSKQYPHLTLPTHCSWLSLRRKIFSVPNFFSSNSHPFGGGSPKESKYSLFSVFCAPVTNPVCAHATEIVHIDDTQSMKKRLFLVARKYVLERDFEVFAPVY